MGTVNWSTREIDEDSFNFTDRIFRSPWNPQNSFKVTVFGVSETIDAVPTVKTDDDDCKMFNFIGSEIDGRVISTGFDESAISTSANSKGYLKTFSIDSFLSNVQME